MKKWKIAIMGCGMIAQDIYEEAVLWIKLRKLKEIKHCFFEKNLLLYIKIYKKI